MDILFIYISNVIPFQVSPPETPVSMTFSIVLRGYLSHPTTYSQLTALEFHILGHQAFTEPKAFSPTDDPTRPYSTTYGAEAMGPPMCYSLHGGLVLGSSDWLVLFLLWGCKTVSSLLSLTPDVLVFWILQSFKPHVYNISWALG